jgi:predicted RNase H-like nuclease (RuvC/YqgF family)
MNIINKFLFRLRLKKIENGDFFINELLYYQRRCEVLEKQNNDLMEIVIEYQRELKELKSQSRSMLKEMDLLIKANNALAKELKKENFYEYK